MHHGLRLDNVCLLSENSLVMLHGIVLPVLCPQRVNDIIRVLSSHLYLQASQIGLGNHASSEENDDGVSMPLL